MKRRSSALALVLLTTCSVAFGAGAPQAIPEPRAEIVPLSSWERGAKLVFGPTDKNKSCSVRMGGGAGGLPEDAGRCDFLEAVPSTELARLRGLRRGKMALDLIEIQKVDGIFLPGIEEITDPPLYYRETQFVVDGTGRVRDCHINKEQGIDILHVAPTDCTPRQRYAATGSEKISKVTVVIALSLWDKRSRVKDLDVEGVLDRFPEWRRK